jgi:Zn finger protein HypA/HybF involved in hydrogenase expression
MHEIGMIQTAFDNLLEQLTAAKVSKVLEIHVRRSSAIPEETLRLVYEARQPGTVLEGARLQVETFDVKYHCPCGYDQPLTHDDLHGHIVICERCGRVGDIHDLPELEIVDVLAEDNPPGADPA